MPSSRDKPVIAAYFEDPEPLGAPLDDDLGEYLRAYGQLAARIADVGGRLVIVRSQKDFLGAGRFARGWSIDGGKLEALDGEVQADVVLDKGDDINFAFDAATRVVNDRAFHRFCNDKAAVYARFTEFCPKTLRVETKDGLAAGMAMIPGDTIVAKPVVGACGRNVIIGSRDDVLTAEHEYPLLLQEFIDTSGGIPGVVDGAHDMRLTIVGGELAYVMVKIPKPGSFVSNYALGGTLKMLDDSQYPADAVDIAMRIDAEFTGVPTRYYSIDMGRNRDGSWKLIEFNSPPGLDPEERHPSIGREMALVAKMLVREATR